MLCATITDGLPPRRNGTPVLHQNPSIPQHPYQQSLDSGLPPSSIHPSTVRTWADYSHVFYHPRSIVQINDYELASSLQPFENWQNGEDLFQATDKDEGIMDRDVRRWIEECDFLQGVQVLVGADDAWGGFGKGMVEGLKDEIGNKQVWVWGVEEERGSGTRVRISYTSWGIWLTFVVDRPSNCCDQSTLPERYTSCHHRRRCTSRSLYLPLAYLSTSSSTEVHNGTRRRCFRWRWRA